jgi:hypothetical protein
VGAGRVGVVVAPTPIDRPSVAGAWARNVGAGETRAMDGWRLRPSETWVRDVQRDVLALGSVVFYLLVLGRALVGPFWDLVVPLLVVGVGLLVAVPLLRGTDLYLTRAMVVAVLVTRHYGDVVFGVFAAVAFVSMVVFAFRLDRPRPAIARGLALGAVLSVGAYALAGAVE